MDKSDFTLVGIILGAGVGIGAVILGFAYGITIVVKWAWEG